MVIYNLYFLKKLVVSNTIYYINSNTLSTLHLAFLKISKEISYSFFANL